jgi:hypothetical protein
LNTAERKFRGFESHPLCPRFAQDFPVRAKIVRLAPASPGLGEARGVRCAGFTGGH